MRTFALKPKATQQTTSAKSTIPGRGHFGQSPEVRSILHLQRTIGNQAVQRMLQTDAGQPEAELNGPASRRFGHDFNRIPIHPPAAGAIQTKLAINKPGDSYEQEADRMAEQVMRTPEPQLQLACPCGGRCPKCTEQPSRERESLQTKHVQASDSGQIAAPPIVHEVLRSPGQPLDPATRTFMEPRFGHDFSRVRVHTDSEAASSAQAIGARAYTAGQHIVFGLEQYDMATGDGRRLLAHELTHILQSPDYGSANDLVKRDEDKGSGHEKRKETAKKAPKCQIAKAQIRPVFFRNDPGNDDPNPTGKSLAPRLQEANRIWGKCGVEFQAEKPKMVEDSQSKIAGNKHEELNAVERAYGKKGTGPQVFFLDNDLSLFGGGRTGPNIGATVAT